MIASQFPITKKAEHWTHGNYNEDFDYIDSGGYNVARNIVYAQCNTPQGTLNVLTLHGYHLEHKNGNEETLKACRELVDFAKSLDGPVVIAGDFNLTPSSESIQFINKSFRNLSVEYKFPTTRNYLTKKQGVCDYIFVNDKVKVKNAYMSNVIASDHNALVLDFSL